MKSEEQKRRPLCFMVVVWGEEFRNYFLRYCLASLMAAGNIPHLCRPGDKFLIATTRGDQAAMRRSAVVREAERYVEFEYLDLDLPRTGRSPVVHSNYYLVQLLNAAYRLGGYAVMLSPDEIFSNELGAVLTKEIASNTELLLVPTIRLAEEPLFDALRESSINGENTTLDLSAESLLRVAIKSLHPEILAAEWESGYFGDYINSAWWPVGRGDGILLHTFSFIPFLIDYSCIKSHDPSAALVSNTDGPYLAHNFPESTRVKMVQEGSAVMTVSWAPWARHNNGILQPKWLMKAPGFGNIIRGALLRHRCEYYTLYCNDWLKRKLFYRPIRWKVGGDDAAWCKVEERAARILRRYLFGLVELDDHEGEKRSGHQWCFQMTVRFATALMPFYQKQRACCLVMKSYLFVVRSALSGDKAAQGRIARRFKKLLLFRSSES